VRKISRRSFLRTIALSSAALTINPSSHAQLSKFVSKPNLIVFLPDELRADLITGNAVGSVHAPSLYRLAAESVVFERAYVTHPICSPSRSSLLTGTWPHQTRCTSNKGVLPPSIRCLPEMVGDSSYRTGYFGKWHLGDEFVPQHGFEEWVSIEDSFKSAERGKRKSGSSNYTQFLLDKGYQPDLHNGKSFSLRFPTTLPFELSKPKFLETKVCDFLERHRREPFILFVAFFEPHPPYNGPFNTEHPLDAITVDPTVENNFGEDMPLRYRLRQDFYRKQNRDAAQYRETKQKYLGLITEIDHSIGAILAKVDDLGLRDQTIMVLTSDHGDMMSAHGMLGKQLMFEQSAVVPYFIRVPGETPRRCAQTVSHIDFVPTLLGLLGKSAPTQCAGQSRANLVRGESSSAADFIFLQWAPTKVDFAIKHSTLASKQEIHKCLSESTRAVVSPDGWKLCLRDRDKNELYHLRDDPDESRNLFYDDAHRDVIDELSKRIRDWQAKIRDRVRV
jgi:arylsulfatase A-like enzyme